MVDINKKLTKEEFNALPYKDRLLIRASNKLTKHFRGLEAANLLSEQETAEYIGYIKELIRLAEGELPTMPTAPNGHAEGSTLA